ncbi:hypothetical protein G7K_3700-t1 [Saitoella complicata NRRL Y-17804]|uniref:non-specific serine/threonine protein kinase n=1 Tax=Saitoella complicata (strain BCRC 22490 / CBS 7301 / JCM 7358 / NBRC 10748 / NRRL Y-17804) TaxID=698492 RepID=A0A0E9NIP9_SAICN|nr:hypothetical protein G7K_3700-t1 [Saitoella complicata NRRL Y-17804]
MGATFSSTTPSSATASLDSFIAEIGSISYEKSLSSARFLKTVRARHKSGPVVVKVFIKPVPASGTGNGTGTTTLKSVTDRLRREQRALLDVPNAYPFLHVLETERAGYLIRQFFFNSLYDRISTRPFLETIEKRWIAYQLLCALRDCHEKGIHHGDIKTENVCVTTWNWAYLVDFCTIYKPTYLPSDNPADFGFYFDTGGRRVCYIAPERFVPADEVKAQNKEGVGVTDAMDVFSVGCVIAEMFLEGTPLFTLSQLFAYRKGEYDPIPNYIDKIDDPHIRSLVKDMINVDPSKRLSAAEYLEQWTNRAFPDYFGNFLHRYLASITEAGAGRGGKLASVEGDAGEDGLWEKEADERIERIWHDFDKISFFLGFGPSAGMNAGGDVVSRPRTTPLPVHLSIPNYPPTPLPAPRSLPPDTGALLFLTLLTSSLRNTSNPPPRLHTLDLVIALSPYLTSESIMDRSIPYACSLIYDKVPIVRIAALRTVAAVLERVQIVGEANRGVFMEYLILIFRGVVADREPGVRAAYAGVLGSLVSSAKRFLEIGGLGSSISESVIMDGEGQREVQSYDEGLQELREVFGEHLAALLADPEPCVRRALLSDMPSLCVFFGPQMVNDVLLSHLITYLNDRDWMLRCAFFDAIVSLGTFLGGRGLEEYILPLMVQSLCDVEEFVVERVITSLVRVTELGLLRKTSMCDLAKIVVRFTVHPNPWIRVKSASFTAACARWMDVADVYCMLYPIVRPFLRNDIGRVEKVTVLENLKKPLSRTLFDGALAWASRADRTQFWKSAREQKIFGAGNPFGTLRNGGTNGPGYSRRGSAVGALDLTEKIAKSEEDEQWLARILKLGSGPAGEDEWKLGVLREYLWRIANVGRMPRSKADGASSSKRGVVMVKELGMTPNTVFFDLDPSGTTSPRVVDTRPSTVTPIPGSVEEALKGAVKAMDTPMRRQGSRATLTAPNSRWHTPRLVAGGSLPKEAIKIPEGRNGTPPRIVKNSPSVSTLASSPRSGVSPNFSSVAGSRRSSLVPVSAQQIVSNLDSDHHSTHSLEHKMSMVSLSTRGREAAKAPAETGMQTATVMGSVNMPMKTLSEAVSRMDTGSPVSEKAGVHRGSHTYRGQNDNVYRLLDTIYTQHYSQQPLEFGPTIVRPSRPAPIMTPNGKPKAEQPWRLVGNLIAHFTEHTGGVNRVVVAPDSAFFLTASDDGMVKVWDTSRLEKNVLNRARCTHRQGNNVKVKALCMVENTHCFISAGDDGSIDVVRAEYGFNPKTGLSQYGKLRVLRKHMLDDGEYAVWIEHFQQDQSSIIIIATNRCRILAVDVVSMEVLYTLDNPPQHGNITCFCIDRRRAWLLVGTSRGVLDVWDLRFLLRLKAWSIGSAPIHRITQHPERNKEKYQSSVYVAGGTGDDEITLWNMADDRCLEVMKVLNGRESWEYRAVRVDEEQEPPMMLEMYTRNGNAKGSSLDSTGSAGSSGVDRSPRAMVAGCDTYHTNDGTEQLRVFLVAAGYDRKVRFWDQSKVVESLIITGQESGEADPTYEQSPESKVKPRYYVEKASSEKRTAVKISRTAALENLLHNHQDVVSDIAFLDLPYGMVVTADRSGVIKVFS